MAALDKCYGWVIHEKEITHLQIIGIFSVNAIDSCMYYDGFLFRVYVTNSTIDFLYFKSCSELLQFLTREQTFFKGSMNICIANPTILEELKTSFASQPRLKHLLPLLVKPIPR